MCHKVPPSEIHTFTTDNDTDYKWGCLWCCIRWYTDRCRADCRRRTGRDSAAVDSDTERSTHLAALQYTSALQLASCLNYANG